MGQRVMLQSLVSLDPQQLRFHDWSGEGMETRLPSPFDIALSIIGSDHS